MIFLDSGMDSCSSLEQTSVTMTRSVMIIHASVVRPVVHGMDSKNGMHSLPTRN